MSRRTRRKVLRWLTWATATGGLVLITLLFDARPRKECGELLILPDTIIAAITPHDWKLFCIYFENEDEDGLKGLYEQGRIVILAKGSRVQVLHKTREATTLIKGRTLFYTGPIQQPQAKLKAL